VAMDGVEATKEAQETLHEEREAERRGRGVV